jgi:hypothetical protein
LQNYTRSHYPTLKVEKSQKPKIYFESKIINFISPSHKDYYNNSYNELVLVHYHTRSIQSLLLKSIHTKYQDKALKNKNEFLLLLNNNKSFFESLQINNLLDTFVLDAKD